MPLPGLLPDAVAQFRRVFVGAPFFIALTNGRDHRVSWSNERFRSLFGTHGRPGMALVDAVPDLKSHGVAEAFDRVLSTGAPAELRGIPLSIPIGRSNVQRIIDLSIHARLDETLQTIGLQLHGTDVTAAGHERAERARQAADQRRELETFCHKAPVGMALLDRDLRYVRINERLAAINGVPVEAHIGRLMWDVVPDLEIRKVAEPLYHHILETGEAVTTELEGETREQPGVIRQWIGHFYPLFDEQGEVVGIGAVVEEITERRRAESERAEAERQREQMVAELTHRVKNTLATVQTIVMRTLSDAVDPAAMHVLTERLGALAQTHTLLAENQWAVDFSLLVRHELAPYGARAQLSGPEVGLSARAAVALTLTLHELATNAAKHGALSEAGGSIDLSWWIEECNLEPALQVVWRESGGPVVREPERTGFGTRLIRRAVPYDLRGEVDLRFQPEGVTCRLVMPMSEVSP